ncbi:MAG: cyclophilin-like family protein [Hyphomicrobium sp.]
MPTNILRQRSSKVTGRDGKRSAAGRARRVLIRIGRVLLHADLLDTPTADRIWSALPLHSSAETWGQAIKFEIPIESGRERGARVLAAAGEVYYVSEDDRVIIAFGPTAISRPGEMRLPRPCNLWATIADDTTLLKVVTPGEKVTIAAA